MTIKIATLLPAVCLAAASLVGAAHADSFATSYSGTVYQPSFNGTSDVVLPPASLGINLGTFTTTGLNSTFCAGSCTTSPVEPTAAQFFGSTYNTGNTATLGTLSASQTLSGTETVFTGTTNNLVAGTTIGFSHDDGLVLFIDGTMVINQPSQTFSSTPCPGTLSTGCGTWIATAGTHNFTLYYAQNNYSPAVLIENAVPPAVTPEPGSIMLLGTGLVGLAGAVRRRIKR